MEVLSPAERSFCAGFFAGDRPARLVLPLLFPRPNAEDLSSMPAADIGPKIADRAEVLYRDGCLPGLSTWVPEECPEFSQGIKLWREATVETDRSIFAQKVKTAARLANEGLDQIGNLTPKLALLRWACCISWLSARATLVAATSAAGCMQSAPSPEASAKVCRTCKRTIFELMMTLTSDVRVLTIYDFDLKGHGIWRGGGREPMTEEGLNEWYRRAIIFDLAMLCHQVRKLPPEDLNDWQPHVTLMQGLGVPDWLLPPQHAPRIILEKHEWLCELEATPMDTQGKLVPGGTKVLNAALPPPPEPDLDDPDVVAKIQRGEELSKQHQEDGLPGALHGSVGLLYAGLCVEEAVEHIALNAGMVGLEGFLDSVLRYGPLVRSLSLADCRGMVGREMLEVVLPLAAPSLHTLDLEKCDLEGSDVEDLISCAQKLPCLRQLDLSGNDLDTNDALNLVEALCESRVDIAALRLDGNPVGDKEDFRAGVAGILARRGAKVVAGGQINFIFGTDAVTWSPNLKPDPPEGTPLLVVKKMTEQQDKRLEEFKKSTEEIFAEKKIKGEAFTVAQESFDAMTSKVTAKNEGAKEYLAVEYDQKAKGRLPESHLRRGVDPVRKPDRPNWMDEL